MASTLVVFKGAEQVHIAALGKGLFIIGRDAGSDLQLDDPAVAGEHCFIIESQGNYNLRDRGSQSGTRLNGRPVTERVPLHFGDAITIGPFTIRFKDEAPTIAPSSAPAPAQPPPPAPQPPPQAFIPPPAASPPGPVPPPVPDPAPDPAPSPSSVPDTGTARLVCENGELKGFTFPIDDAGTSIGRDKQNSVVLRDDAASKIHAKVYREGFHYLIEDLCSSNGTQVNGQRTQKKQLSRSDKIKIGETVFTFHDAGATQAAPATHPAHARATPARAQAAPDDTRSVPAPAQAAPAYSQTVPSPPRPASYYERRPAGMNKSMVPIIMVFVMLIGASAYMAYKLFLEESEGIGPDPGVATNTVPTPITNVQAPAATNAVTPVVTNAVKPVVTNAVKPVVTNAVKPVVTNAVKPVVTNAVKPVVTNAVKPVVTNTAPPVTFLVPNTVNPNEEFEPDRQIKPDAGVPRERR